MRVDGKAFHGRSQIAVAKLRSTVRSRCRRNLEVLLMRLGTTGRRTRRVGRNKLRARRGLCTPTSSQRRSRNTQLRLIFRRRAIRNRDDRRLRSAARITRTPNRRDRNLTRIHRRRVRARCGGCERRHVQKHHKPLRRIRQLRHITPQLPRKSMRGAIILYKL